MRSVALICRPPPKLFSPSLLPRHTRLTMSAIDHGNICVSYVTDVEGNLDFWRRFCKMSEVVEYNGDLNALRLSENCHLVVGGDSVDKGDGDLRYLQSILNLKEQHPERVHLVLGNRDINKLRFLAELSEEHWLDASDHPGVYWRQRPGGGAHTPLTFLESQPADDGGRWRADTFANRLRYMLADNMGSPKAFEYRRAELVAMRREAAVDAAQAEAAEVAGVDSSASPTGGAAIGAATGSEASSEPVGICDETVSDEEVLASFLDSMFLPSGLMRSYIQQAKLVCALYFAQRMCDSLP